MKSKERSMKAKYQSELSRTWSIALLLLLFFLGTTQIVNAGQAAGAQPSTGAVSEQSVPASTLKKGFVLKKGAKELLWQVTSPQGGVLYLLGTVHVFKPEDYPLPVEMEKAFSK